MPNTPSPPPAPMMAVAQSLSDAVVPLVSSSGDYSALCEWIGSSSIVLLGEATHGTHEFARARAAITKRLITEHGFAGVAIDASSHAAHRVHRFIHGEGSDHDSIDALNDFPSFPGWKWRNADMLDFIGWLQAYNNSPTHPSRQTAGFYGLDLYQLPTAIGQILRFMRTAAIPELTANAESATRFFSAFEHFAPFSGVGITATAGGEEIDNDTLTLSHAAENEIISYLLARFRPRLIPPFLVDKAVTPEEAEQALFASVRPYYETLLRDRTAFWNLRERTMAATLDNLLHSLPSGVKLVVWAHNIHLGDARATELSSAGELSLGQLIRERHSANAFLVGMTTNRGTLTTAPHWGASPIRQELLAAATGSLEALLHQIGEPRFLLDLKNEEALESLQEPLLQRAVGAIYHPETERECHYFRATVAEQFDALIHFDETRAVEPLES